MISFIYISLFVFCFAYSTAGEQALEGGTTPAPDDVAHRELTDSGYVIRYGDSLFKYPVRIVPLIRRIDTEEKLPTETNEIETGDDEKRRPLFYFTTYEDLRDSRNRNLPTSRPYIEIRKKRNAESLEVPESSKVGKLRKKRTYCNRCGGGGGGYYVPVTYVVYPAYGGGGRGGRGKGCYTCGGGGGGGYGGGGGGSYSFSSSSAQSSAGSFGWGKK